MDKVKTALRNTMKQRRCNTCDADRMLASHQISTRILALESYKKAQHIALYFSVGGEIDVSALWHHACAAGKCCYFPVLQEDLTLAFLPATPLSPLKKNRYKIPEPDLALDFSIPIETLDLIIAPLLAFDPHCTRLGMGAGYYDRTLKNKTHNQLIGVAFPFQLVDFIEPQPWDIPLDAVVTPETIYWRRGILLPPGGALPLS